MNNLAISLKKFFTNKNVVTIIGVVAIIVILYFLYTKTIDNATEMIQVPVAADRISPQTLIDADKVTFASVANAAKPDNVIMDTKRIVGKYTGVGVTVPKGAMFYEDYVVEKEELPGNWLTLLEKDQEGNLQIPYYFAVNVTTTFGNSIQPNDLVDFYVRTYDENQKLIFGKMLSNVKVLAVTDSQGKDVFRSQDDIGTPAFLNFGLTTEFHDVLKKAEYLQGTDLEVIVVPHGGTLEDNKGLEIEVSSEELREIILVRAKDLEVKKKTSNSNSNEPSANDPLQTVNP